MNGFFNFNKYLKSRVTKIESGRTTGTLYHLMNKGYPGMIPGDEYVMGQIISFDDHENAILEMDCLEGYCGIVEDTNAYNRMTVNVEITSSGHILCLDAYIYNMDAPCNAFDERIHLPDGNWAKFMEAPKESLF